MTDEEKDALKRWWVALPEEDKAEAKRFEEGDPLPEWVQQGVRDAGISPVATSWWPSSLEDEAMTVPAELVAFVAEQSPPDVD
ncbi:hypothetical protein [Ornithinicoccus halotolerans]|uniref:hypothetical protein n=1 Tax=Ornithinicoccus halotolerans TaxID=1748220 RepID=UPI001295A811|nr:hypothetical protein [Ornithinicoccus halotolerans]